MELALYSSDITHGDVVFAYSAAIVLLQPASWLSSWYILLEGRVLVRSPNENCSLPETSMPVIIEIRGVVVVLYCWVGEGVVVVDSQCQAKYLYGNESW